MRVLHVGKYYPPHAGGMETHLQSLCSELRKRVDIRVLVANDGREDREEVIDGVPVTRLGTKLNFRSTPICPTMARTIRHSGADLLHIHLPNPAAILAYFASGFKGPVVLTWHSDIIRQRFLGKVFEPIERLMVRRSSAIIAGSPDYIAYSPVLYEHRSRCRIIPFGIPVRPSPEYQNGATSEVRNRYKEQLLLSVGRLVKYKGYRYLIRAMKDVRATLLLIGEGPERVRLEAEAHRLAVEDRVMFLGRVADTSEYYRACDIFVLPSVSRNEAFGLVQLEAMACGKPVVNTHLRSGVPFVSVHGLTGVTVPPADANALARAINVLLEDPDRRAAYGAAAKQRVETEFSLAKMVSETYRVYIEVMAADVRSEDEVKGVALATASQAAIATMAGL
jgi:glycosyltransferase involved in cell wall biosynthesis